MHGRRLLVFVGIFTLILTGCGGSHLSSATPTATPVGWGLPDEEAIRAVLNAEARGVQAQDIDLLMSLWSEEGEVRDARHTPTDPSDDIVWSGKTAIYQRYVHLVFPGNPSVVEHPDVDIHVEGNQAVVTSTTRIGQEVAPGGDRWELRKENGVWKLLRLVYNNE